jgi:hypothetical protein
MSIKWMLQWWVLVHCGDQAESTGLSELVGTHQVQCRMKDGWELVRKQFSVGLQVSSLLTMAVTSIAFFTTY